ncbi:hypothetical protein [Polaromonas naphthalenivorans]|uniref:hypothetical protein n=1 Tax=Polaromonas naphthalenivorans TaxID=216465 RepID=UPI00059D7FE4|nr:hypothetical protein [Polaromonas naphthalenivorans]
MLKRFCITMALAIAAALAIGLLCQTLSALLLCLLAWGPGFIALLFFYVLPSQEQALKYRSELSITPP